MDFDLAMAIIEEHKQRTGHDAWKLTRWNFCDPCMWLMNVCKKLRAQQSDGELAIPEAPAPQNVEAEHLAWMRERDESGPAPPKIGHAFVPGKGQPGSHDDTCAGLCHAVTMRCWRPESEHEAPAPGQETRE